MNIYNYLFIKKGGDYMMKRHMYTISQLVLQFNIFYIVCTIIYVLEKSIMCVPIESGLISELIKNTICAISMLCKIGRAHV